MQRDQGAMLAGLFVVRRVQRARNALAEPQVDAALVRGRHELLNLGASKRNLALRVATLVFCCGQLSAAQRAIREKCNRQTKRRISESAKKIDAAGACKSPARHVEE